MTFTVKHETLFKGRFNIIVRDAQTLEPVRESGWFDNIITDYGLNQLGTAGALNGCVVGTGSAAEVATDLLLQNRIARTNTNIGTSITTSTVAPQYSGRVITYRFPEGAAAGNISEVGICAQIAEPGNLWSRSLIKDTNGQPTTITVLGNEVLDVVYECRVYTMQGDTTGGPIMLFDVPYNWTIRSAGAGSDQTYMLIGGTGSPGVMSVSWGATNGDISTPNNWPSGVNAGLSNQVVASAYVNNSLKRALLVHWPIGSGNNAPGGIKSFSGGVSQGNPVAFQVGFDRIFPKNNTIAFSINFEWSWGRKVI